MAPDTLNDVPAPVLFPQEVSIRDSAGSSYKVKTLTRALAARHSDDILRIHSLIPNVAAWGEPDLLADESDGREYLHKWQVSTIVADASTGRLVGFLIAYFRRSCERHPFDGVYIHRMAIDAPYQRRKIGRRLVSVFLAALHSAVPWLRVVSVQTNDAEENGGVLQFYESSGFRRLAHVHYAWKTDWLLWTDLLHREQSQAIGAPHSAASLSAHPHVQSPVDGCPVLFLSTSNTQKFAELDFLFSCYNFQIVRVPPPAELTEPQVESSDPDYESELVRHPLTIAAKSLRRTQYRS